MQSGTDAARRDGEAGRAVTFSKSEQRGEDNSSHGGRQTEEFLFIIRRQQSVYLLPAALPRVAYLHASVAPPPSSTFVSCEEILNLDPTAIKAASNWMRRMSTAALWVADKDGGSCDRRVSPHIFIDRIGRSRVNISHPSLLSCGRINEILIFLSRRQKPRVKVRRYRVSNDVSESLIDVTSEIGACGAHISRVWVSN